MRHAKVVFLLMLAAPAGPAVAHHSTLGFFDPDRIIEIEGIVQSVSMMNPHIRFVVDVTESSGETVEWHIESSALSILRTRGLDQDFMQPGDRVRLAGAASQRNLPEMSARNILLEDGTEVLIALSATPYFTDPETGDLLEPLFSDAVTEAARASADGIFRVWSTVLGDPDAFPMFKGVYPLTDAARAARDAWDSTSAGLLECWKKGTPLIMITPLPMEFVRQGDDILLRFEEDDAERLIHMSDAAQPPAGHSFYGHSTGHWEGDTLVVETVNIDAPDFDDKGTPQSPEISLVERFTLSENRERLDYTITITDLVTFTQPFELSRYWVWRPEIVLRPWNCDELQ